MAVFIKSSWANNKSLRNTGPTKEGGYAVKTIGIRLADLSLPCFLSYRKPSWQNEKGYEGKGLESRVGTL